jgi:iron transport multicopper oxidase
VGLSSTSSSLSTTSVTQGGDELRTSWYSNQPNLSPATVSGPTFGQLFTATLSGQINAQPLLSQGVVLVATQTNNIYGLDAETGNVIWQRNLGNPFLATDEGCPDITPTMGITGTPVIDRATNTAYLLAKSYITGNSGPVAWTAHAVDVATGTEKMGFPLVISGTASNEPAQTFGARNQGQRAGLLLMNGVVYVGFGSLCDIVSYSGWIVGFTTSGQMKTLWTTVAGAGQASGAGVWQAGGGLVSDGDGQIVFETGNIGGVAGPIPGTTPPKTLANSVVRLTVQQDGSLVAKDFFSPYDSVALDSWDGDFGSGGAVGLPSAYFGTTSHPNLLVAQGKSGYVYLIDRDHLGGIGNGMGGGDDVVNRTGPYGGFWSKTAIWPGDGGYLWIPSASSGASAGGSAGNLQVLKYGVDGSGTPALSLAGTSSDSFGFTSSSPIVTSDGTQSGSALVWIVWSPDGTGNGAQLRAYDAVPSNRTPILRYSAPIGQAAKFTPPGVGLGRIYVGTRDGHLLAFGAPASPALQGSGVSFGYVVTGQSSASTLTLTATKDVSVTGATSSSSEFTLGTSSPAFPATIPSGSTLQIPVVFAPSAAGMRAGSVSVTTNFGVLSFSVSGTGQTPDPNLTITPPIISFGGTVLNGHLAQGVTLTNTGASGLTISSIVVPGAPFGVMGAPAPNFVLGSSASITMNVSFDPTAVGMYTSQITLNTSVGTRTIQLSGSCSTPGVFTITPLGMDFGAVAVGYSASMAFTVANTGGTTVTVTKSKPPALGAFLPLTSLPEGTTLVPGATLTVYVSFNPMTTGVANDGWVLNADDGTGVRTVQFTGVGATDLTAKGTPIALITSPQGGGNRSLSVIADGVLPTTGSTDSSQEYDTYTGSGARTEDWIGYTFPKTWTFQSLLYQEGIHFGDGGWFTSLKVQVHQGGAWVDVPGLVTSPSYTGAAASNFTTYMLKFPAVTGDGIRIDGAPGGAAKFISVGELRPVGSAVSGTNQPPTANAGAAATVTAGATVVLDGSGSSDPNGDPITYLWSQTGGPAVTLSNTTAVQPIFTAPSVTSTTTLTFSLVVSDGSLQSAPSSVTVTVNPPSMTTSYTDVTASGTIVALITAPQGGGNRNLEVIRDGVMPPAGSTSTATEYDTYTGTTRTEDWIGYTFSSAQSFGKVVFQEGPQFWDGGWFTSLKIQVLQGSTWVNVSGATVTPAYPGANGVGYETFTFTFPSVTATGIRIDGAPGGASTFISVGELRVFTVAGGGTTNLPPTANAGAAATVTAGATVMLDGSGSSDPNGDPITYLWSQTGGPAVTLSSTTAVQPTFTAPSVTSTTTLTFSLVVSDGSLQSPPSSVTVTVNPPSMTTSYTDVTASGTIVALITAPQGGGNRNIGVIRDGVMPPAGSTDTATEYDTYTGMTRTEDWIGYTFSSAQSFGKVVFQEGPQFWDGGWFTSLKIQVLQGSTWVNVSGAAVTPAYPGANGVGYETFTFTFPSVTATGIRIDGAPGGASTFISVGELRVFTVAGGGGTTNLPPTANAGAAATVTAGATVMLDGSGSSDPNGDPITYLWSQTGGPAVTLSSTTAVQPTFTAPSVTSTTTLTFSLVVSDGSLQSPPSSVTVTVNPPSMTTSYTDVTASGTIVALITAPQGGGNRNIGVIRDGVMPPAGSTSSATEYDTYTGMTRTEDWIGYTFSSAQSFGKVVFQEGPQFWDGGWFTSLRIQVLQGGSWVNVPGTAVTPAYPGANGVGYETFTFTFPAISATGIRIDGAPGGASTFISVGELRVFTTP